VGERGRGWGWIGGLVSEIRLGSKNGVRGTYQAEHACM